MSTILDALRKAEAEASRKPDLARPADELFGQGLPPSPPKRAGAWFGIVAFVAVSFAVGLVLGTRFLAGRRAETVNRSENGELAKAEQATAETRPAAAAPEARPSGEKGPAVSAGPVGGTAPSAVLVGQADVPTVKPEDRAPAVQPRGDGVPPAAAPAAAEPAAPPAAAPASQDVAPEAAAAPAEGSGDDQVAAEPRVRPVDAPAAVSKAAPATNTAASGAAATSAAAASAFAASAAAHAAPAADQGAAPSAAQVDAAVPAAPAPVPPPALANPVPAAAANSAPAEAASAPAAAANPAPAADAAKPAPQPPAVQVANNSPVAARPAAPAAMGSQTGTGVPQAARGSQAAAPSSQVAPAPLVPMVPPSERSKHAGSQRIGARMAELRARRGVSARPDDTSDAAPDGRGSSDQQVAAIRRPIPITPPAASAPGEPVTLKARPSAPETEQPPASEHPAEAPVHPADGLQGGDNSPSPPAEQMAAAVRRSPTGAPQVAINIVQWSSAPTRRFAFVTVDGSAMTQVREGDRVGGLTVKRIYQRAVEFGYNDSSFLMRAN